MQSHARCAGVSRGSLCCISPKKPRQVTKERENGWSEAIIRRLGAGKEDCRMRLQAQFAEIDGSGGMADAACPRRVFVEVACRACTTANRPGMMLPNRSQGLDSNRYAGGPRPRRDTTCRAFEHDERSRRRWQSGRGRGQPGMGGRGPQNGQNFR